jgi:ubiquinone/menaquinone biosynthesis C-methylase UbiE
LGEIAFEFGQVPAAQVRDLDYLSDINLSQEDITDLSYQDKKFDKVFCISVIEHLPSHELILQTLKEFKRVLKDDGLIVLTYDYPDITPDVFSKLIKEAGLQYDFICDASIPNDAISRAHLKCFRALLRKA